MAAMRTGKRMRTHHLGMAVFIGAMLTAQVVFAGDSLPQSAPKNLVPIVHGPNWIDLNGDGQKDLVVKARYSAPNPSPHSFSVYSFNILTNEDIGVGNRDIHWYVVSFPDLAPPVGRLEMTTGQGSECMVRDIRLLIRREQDKPSTATIIQAERKVTGSYGDPETVTFTTYKLEKGSPKSPNEFAFVEVSREESKSRYCSVTEAFLKELGLPNPDSQSDPETQTEANQTAREARLELLTSKLERIRSQMGGAVDAVDEEGQEAYEALMNQLRNEEAAVIREMSNLRKGASK